MFHIPLCYHAGFDLIGTQVGWIDSERAICVKFSFFKYFSLFYLIRSIAAQFIQGSRHKAIAPGTVR